MTLAIHGGTPVRTRLFPPPPDIGHEEREAVNRVLDSGVLSGFIADEPEGGPEVQALEAEWEIYFGVRYAVAMNSATSALCAAVVALGIGPGDEVIVPPWTMSASVACVVHAGATPVFADIDPETYGLSADSVYERLTEKTKGIVVVDLFGCIPRDMHSIMHIASNRGIWLIEDASQAPGASLHGRMAGTLGDIGVFSLNRHKVIQAGEGGVAVTNSPDIADRLKETRNHGEVRGGSVGYNFRMPELEAAIARVQLTRLRARIVRRNWNARRISGRLTGLGLRVPIPPADDVRAWYLHVVKSKVPAWQMVRVLRAEGIPVSQYVEPLYRLPAFREGNAEHAWPNIEEAYESVIAHPLIHGGMTEEDIEDVVAAFRKVSEHRKDL